MNNQQRDLIQDVGCQGNHTRPHGEVGSPARGGYSLREVLEWDPKLYKEIQVCPLWPVLFAQFIIILSHRHISGCWLAGI